jgi:hypothetical protein
MPDPAADFANAKKALVVAPAGCGKTHLIAAAVKKSSGRQLVLTHTHAGVKALRDRMDELQVPPGAYHITTLDSFSLRYASAYPSVSGWTVKEPERAQWSQLRPAALKVVKLEAIADVLQSTYGGVFVDEYQDCGLQQHALITRLSEVLPCRIVGDPLQAVFAVMNDRNQDSLSWRKVEADFPQLPQLNTAHRWTGKNEKLGQWLLEIREPLLKNQPINLSGVRFVTHIPITQATIAKEQRDICYALARCKGETVIAMRDMRNRCHDLSGQLGNLYSVFEDAEGADLLASARLIEGSAGIVRVKAVVATAQKWLTLSAHNLDALIGSLAKNKLPAVRDPLIIAIHPLLTAVRDQSDLGACVPAMKAIGALPNAKYRSQEVWLGLIDGVSMAAATPGLSIRDAIWKRRDLMRRVGRRPPPRCLSTPLLVKGLQCDHGVVLNSAEFRQAESLYVTMTRASRTLTILGSSPIIQATLRP